MRDAEKLRLSQSLHFLSSNGVDGFSTPPPAHMGIPPYHHLDPAKVHGKLKDSLNSGQFQNKTRIF